MIISILLILGFTPFTTATYGFEYPISQFCGSDTSDQYYTENSTYLSNLKILYPMLINNTLANPSSFAKGSIGVVPDTVFALFLCRGDVGAFDCRQCAATGFQDAQTVCTFNKEVTMFYDECLIHYSNYDFFDPVNHVDIDSVGDLNGTSQDMCVPDFTPNDCWKCLENITNTTMSNFRGEQGTTVLGVPCGMWYSTAKFYEGKPMWHITPPADAVAQQIVVPVQGKKRHVSKVLVITLPALLLASIFCMTIYFKLIRSHRKGSRNKAEMNVKEMEDLVLELEGRSSEFRVYDFSQILVATDNFLEENKLGQGGFGPVYKGQFPDGLEIAVKRLASHSGQGLTEFKNEIQLIAKLQHTNLVRLMGCCCQGEEKMLVYEFCPNKSLDFFIFDETRRTLLDWNGQGLFSVKSDVFSFGVLILEIISGKKTSSFHGYGDFISLLGYAWQLWKDGLWLQLVDTSLVTEVHTQAMMKCINIALLCVQENAADRPSMSNVVNMLSSENMTLPEPKHPAYFHIRVGTEEVSIVLEPSSLNNVTMSALDGR
ncbi:unnamed protein product [Urochloa decumbens]|uniref:Uncharacterized protein n=1 Tax=Urochloa decumbens TaxID=240449 RepID=A0ABC9ALW1_9POAL